MLQLGQPAEHHAILNFAFGHHPLMAFRRNRGRFLGGGGLQAIAFVILMSVFKGMGVAIGSLGSDEGIEAAHCRTWRH